MTSMFIVAHAQCTLLLKKYSKTKQFWHHVLDVLKTYKYKKLDRWNYIYCISELLLLLYLSLFHECNIMRHIKTLS
jgi:hypothetical protein